MIAFYFETAAFISGTDTSDPSPFEPIGVSGAGWWLPRPRPASSPEARKERPAERNSLRVFLNPAGFWDEHSRK